MSILRKNHIKLCGILGAIIMLIAAPESAEATVVSCSTAGTGIYHDWARIGVHAPGRPIKKNGASAPGLNTKVKKNEAKAALKAMMRAGFDDDGNPWTSRFHLDMVKANSKRLGEFRGAAGLVSYVWIEILEAMLGGNAEFSATDKAEVRAWGRINENETAPNDTQLGFRYNSNNGSGHVWVTMCFEIRIGNSNAAEPTTVVRYALKTEVADCGFGEIARGTGSVSDPIFTGSYLPFTASGNSALSDFDKKLEAVNFKAGKTDDLCAGHTPPTDGYVNVKRIFWKKDGDGSIGAGDERSSLDYPNLFLPSAESCLDMFFGNTVTGYPAQFNTGDPRPEYCLGRCTDPPIVNSGA